MRSTSSLFLVCAMLFVSGIGFIIAGERVRRQTVGATPGARPATAPVASIKQLMQAMVAPNAAKVYDAVAFYSDASGMRETAPSSDAEWQAIASSAAVLIEAGNLMLDSRAVDTGEWVTQTRAFMREGDRGA